MTVSEIFETMDYGPAPESAADAMAWLDRNDRAFGLFIDGDFTAARNEFTSSNPATGEVLAYLTQATADDVTKAVKAAKRAQGKWEKLGGHGRARILYALARLLQKHSRLFAVLETLDNGKPIREARDIDIPLAQRHFYFHAGMAQLMEDELPDRRAIGVCGQIIPWNFPLLMLAWKIAPALAMGSTVVLKPAEYTSLTALLFAQICQEAGLPKGVVNIVTGDGSVGELIVASDVDKIAFTGSTNVGRTIREATAGSGKALTLELGGKSPYIVFDDADIDSAVEGLVDAILFNQGQVCCAGSRLLVQEPIAEGFYTKLRARMDKLRVVILWTKASMSGQSSTPFRFAPSLIWLPQTRPGKHMWLITRCPTAGVSTRPRLSQACNLLTAHARRNLRPRARFNDVPDTGRGRTIGQ